ncbi:hypothetical protein SAY86_014710 [Trapa natans]|uniref:Uncharacterized protein n=1 Tax=Trapa natans TaxID=22666 RepID=A0AAN7KGD1_TRANT|nr:hypothetical protein SAY86_014710 [Trapa natans]
MEAEFWSSRLQSAKHLIAAQASCLTSDYHLVLDESEGDEDARAYFTCPFCYVETEVNLLCSHLQDGHCFDLKNAACPLCAANLGKEATGHFVAQHTSSLKRRKKSQKYVPWMGASATAGKELSLILWSSATHRKNQNETSPDPLLSPFICNTPVSGPEEIHQLVGVSEKHSSVALDSKIVQSPLSDEVCGRDYEMGRERAEFVQQLLGSTIF